MAEIAISIIAKLAEYLVDPVVRQGQYLLCASKITKALETEKQRLASAQDGVQKHVQEALNRNEKIHDAVEKWLGEVRNHMDDVHKLEHQMKENNNCFQGRCPNSKRYHLCKEMAKRIQSTIQLIERNNFSPLSFPAPLPDIEYFSSRNFMYFQSTKLASNELLAALRDDGSHMIGLYGMGGSGKTTLVKEVGRKAKELKLFDRVVFVVVSQTLDIRKIQYEIADLLGLKLHEESEMGRARRLSMRLSSGERILMILDDVWNQIDLMDIGIPFEDYHIGCKILLTTRRQDVCLLMKCDRRIPLHLLSEEESWTFFQAHACIDDKSLNSVAQEIVRECKGLPIAIVAVAGSLKGQSVEEWKEVLRRLKDAKKIQVEEGVRDAFACLRLSYDYLRNNKTKLIFLMCCMYPEDQDIFVEDLFRIAIGLGLCKEAASLEEARMIVRACISNLINACLLMHSEEKNDHLRMHGTVRDVALWIGSKENRTILVCQEDMNVLAEYEFIQDCYAFAFWCNETSQIPQQLDAPKLEILLLNNVSSFELSEALFRGMKALKVMGIVSGGHSLLRFVTSSPKPMHFLTNLRTLRLQGWQLDDDLSWLVGLKRLEVLDLKGSTFKELPKGLQELTKLKLLDLSSINEQSYEVIEGCTQLEELYAHVQLSKTSLKLGKCASNDDIFPKLRRYVLKIGNFESDIYYQCDVSMYFSRRALSLGSFSSGEINTISASSSFIWDLLQRAEVVFLDNLDGGCENILPDNVQFVRGMNELTSLRLHSSSNIEYVVDATSHQADLFQETLFPKVIKLNLQFLANLKEIWRGPPSICCFQKLQELHVSDCPMLASLFPKSVGRALLLLQSLTITGCSELKNIMEAEDDTGTHEEIIPVSDNSYLAFSHLKSLTICSCDKLEYVFSNSCVQGLMKLEDVCIEGASQIKYAFGDHEDEHQKVQIKLPVLKSLKLDGLENLFSIFPRNYHSCCPSLRILTIRSCGKLQGAFWNSCVQILERLEEVCIEGASKLKHVFGQLEDLEH